MAQTDVDRLIQSGKDALPGYSSNHSDQAEKAQAYGMFAIAAAIKYYADTMREISEGVEQE